MQVLQTFRDFAGPLETLLERDVVAMLLKIVLQCPIWHIFQKDALFRAVSQERHETWMRTQVLIDASLYL
jgi:hypothetical protein